MLIPDRMAGRSQGHICPFTFVEERGKRLVCGDIALVPVFPLCNEGLEESQKGWRKGLVASGKRRKGNISPNQRSRAMGTHLSDRICTVYSKCSKHILPSLGNW